MTGVPFDVRAVFGVDFSGARRAGRATWLAELRPAPARSAGAPYRLENLAALSELCGAEERAPALAALVRRVAGSGRSLWALGFPFGLPAAALGGPLTWPAQLARLRAHGEDAYGFGLDCLSRAAAETGRMHMRRLTDVEARAPFDPYHFRIIYQTFYGMRDVLAPLRRQPGTAVLPFQYRKLGGGTPPGSAARNSAVPFSGRLAAALKGRAA